MPVFSKSRFLDQMASITRDKQAEIVLYGANERSMEASVAMEKLNREGFSNVHILSGGMETWLSSGYSLAGDASGPPPDPQNRPHLEAGMYRVDTEQSVIEWAGLQSEHETRRNAKDRSR